MVKYGLRLFLSICLVTVLPAHAAEVVAPDVLARTVTEEVLAMLRADKTLETGDSVKAGDVIEKRILPHFEFSAMTRLALGKHWGQATREQRTALTSEFRTLLVRAYASSLALYHDQMIEYRPLKLAPGDSDVIVRSTIRQAEGEPISVDYRMERTESGWKVYDVRFPGISLVENYRSAFSAEVQRSGIDGLIRALAEKNRTLSAKSKATVQC